MYPLKNINFQDTDITIWYKYVGNGNLGNVAYR